MKYLLVIIAFVFAMAGKSQTADSASTVKKDTAIRKGPSAIGTVSHKFKECGTVILVYNKERNDTIVYIPMGMKLGDFDVEGKVLSFRYRHLMIKNPKGCFHGGPVYMWDVKEVPQPPHHKHSRKTTTTGS